MKLMFALMMTASLMACGGKSKPATTTTEMQNTTQGTGGSTYGGAAYGGAAYGTPASAPAPAPAP